MCNCKSYNLDLGVDEEVVLMPPFQDKTVCIDKCISDVIVKVWSTGVKTRGSCCGHDKFNPSIILCEETSDQTIGKVKSLLSKEDNRDFDVLMWKCKLTKV